MAPSLTAAAAATALALLSCIPLAAPAWSPPSACATTPDPARWQDAGTPDTGLDPMRITVHRGAANLAPENTIPAFEYAIAYGLDMIEVDVQQTLDGRYVVFHDYQVDDKTDESGYIPLMTYDRVTKINAAGNDKWRSTEYNPTYIPSLEAVLALASAHGVGINFDLKESVWNAAGVALLAKQYPGVIERSIFQPYVPVRTEQILAAAPDATIMLNPQTETPPAALYAAGAEYDWFGSDLELYPPEAIAAVHDACDFVMPNVYSDNKARERDDLLTARSFGADGAMVNNPDVAAATLDRPVATRIVVTTAKACLVGKDDLGLPGKTVTVDGAPSTTRRGGCIDLPAGWRDVSFAGDGSALPSAAAAA